MSDAPRVLFYVQHLLGIGHLARASRIAGALAADGFAVTAVTGGAPVPGFPGPDIATSRAAADRCGRPGIFRAHRSRRQRRSTTPTRRAAATLLLQALVDIRPDIVILEAYPFGRRQMRFELLPLIETIADAMEPKPMLVTSVRDILQERVKPGRNEETVDILNRHFDLVLVHGDPAFAPLADTFPARRLDRSRRSPIPAWSQRRAVAAVGRAATTSSFRPAAARRAACSSGRPCRGRAPRPPAGAGC